MCPTAKDLGHPTSSHYLRRDNTRKNAQGRVYALTTQDAQATDNVVIGILLSLENHAKILLILHITFPFALDKDFIKEAKTIL